MFEVTITLMQASFWPSDPYLGIHDMLSWLKNVFVITAAAANAQIIHSYNGYWGSFAKHTLCMCKNHHCHECYIPVLHLTMKERPWVEYLYKSAKEEGIGTLLGDSAFNHERVPMSCLYALVIRQTITHTEITSDFEVESWWHTTLWMAACPHGVHHISYVCLIVCKDAL